MRVSRIFILLLAGALGLMTAVAALAIVVPATIGRLSPAAAALMLASGVGTGLVLGTQMTRNG